MRDRRSLSCATAARSVRRRDGRSARSGRRTWNATSLLRTIDVIDSYQHVEAVIAAFGAGEIVVVTDDDDRENEGDLFVAASLCTPEKMAFIIRHTSGIVCAPLSAEHAKRLHLDPMVAANDAPLGTAFTVSVDCRHGSPRASRRRSAPIPCARSPTATAGPPISCGPGTFSRWSRKDGGVLMRSGHTEACVDLCRLAGCRRSASLPS